MCSPPFQAQISVTQEHVILSLYKQSRLWLRRSVNAVSIGEQMIMCDKVTHKNLIDSSPLFREKTVYNLERQGGVISNPSRKLVPQLHIESNTGMILFPKAVSE